MGCLFTLTLILLSRSILITEADQDIKSARLLDLYLRDYTFKSFNKASRTGSSQGVRLPGNFSGISINAARFRCGSLRRYGAQIKEFHIDVGVIVRPCVERVMIVAQNLDQNWSSLYYSNYDLSGYQLVSPILGLLGYNGGNDPFEVGIVAGEKPISIDFTNSTRVSNVTGIRPYCASFEENGKVRFAKTGHNSICYATRDGHFGLVIEEPQPVQLRRRESRWKVAAGSAIGAALGAFLLGLLLIAMFVRVKKRSMMDELERRAYEEEALQVSMVGHVRAPTASVSRTMPIIEHNYLPPH